MLFWNAMKACNQADFNGTLMSHNFQPDKLHMIL